MKDVKEMTYKELEREVIANHCELTKASLTRQRELCIRSHDLMTEMDRRWENAAAKAKK